MAMLLIGLFLLLQSDTKFASASGPTSFSSSCLENQQERNNHCLKYDYEIQGTLASTKPPFDNYFNISRAIYPSEELPSELIHIWVHFINSFTNLTQVCLRKFIWSRSCLYVSDRYLSLGAMELYSLGSIWPNRKQMILHITIPIFCNSEASEQKLVQFLSTLEDIAGIPAQLNPAVNHVKCVVEDKPLGFELQGVEKTFPHICWAVWFFSILAGYFTTVAFIQRFQERQKDVVVKVTIAFSNVFVGVGLSSSTASINLGRLSEGYKMVYPSIYLFSMALTYTLSYVYCVLYLKHINHFLQLRLACVYPGSFVMIHSILWMIVGTITEPYWAISVVTSYAAAACLFYLLLGFIYSPERVWDIRDTINFTLLSILFSSVMSVQFLYFLVGSHSKQGLISSVIPSALIVIFTFRCGRFNSSKSQKGNDVACLKDVSLNSPQLNEDLLVTI